MQNPIGLLAKALWLTLNGRTRLESDVGEIDIVVDGERFTAFRKVVVIHGSDQSVEPGAIFQVRFHFKNLSIKTNQRLSLIPIPLIMAQRGFHSKTWLLGEKTSDFLGYYEFDTVEHAEAYWNSLPLKMMRKRAASGSLSHEVRLTHN
ncbi:hypothetical protein KQI63_01040 [bacterium]|nr:hypothetical protein [bacterium]